MTKTEALLITGAVALAMVPRFEAGVTNYVKTHRTEIQMAMNQMQGKPPIPFAAPEAAPAAVPEVTPAPAPSLELAYATPQGMPNVRDLQAQMRAQVAAARAATRATRANFVRVEMAGLQPKLANLRFLALRDANVARVYRLNAKKCPLPPAVPTVPTPESFTIETGSLP